MGAGASAVAAAGDDDGRRRSSLMRANEALIVQFIRKNVSSKQQLKVSLIDILRVCAPHVGRESRPRMVGQ
jgi:hypothetical protein